ncbi:MAG: DUF3082 domain-containing protein [Microcoleaceae cyanobacterium]
MNSPNPDSHSKQTSKLTPWRCFSNSAVLGSIGLALFFLTRSIMQVYSRKEMYTDNYLAIQMSVAVKTLVTGLSMMGTGVFSFLALGLLILGVKLLIQQLIQGKTDMN